MGNDVRLLIVDDSKTMCMTLERILGTQYTVSLAYDGDEGIAAYQERRPDIILLDLNMPRVNGFMVISHIREQCQDHDTVILVLTANEEDQMKVQALNMGANDFLIKPFDRTELQARVSVASRQVLTTRALRQTNIQITRELQTVAALQHKLLPQHQPMLPGMRLESLFRPSGHASGDYFDYLDMGNNTLRAIVADISGHGARAAFIMSIVRTLFQVASFDKLSLSATFSIINRHLLSIIGTEDDFITAFAADINFKEHKITYINAAHCPGVLHHPDKPVQYLKPATPIMGFFDLDFTLAAHTIPFEHGSELLVYTDGFYEWEPTPGVFMTHEEFADMASSLFGQSTPYLPSLMQALEGLANGPPVFRDDLTALWLKCEA